MLLLICASHPNTISSLDVGGWLASGRAHNFRPAGRQGQEADSRRVYPPEGERRDGREGDERLCGREGGRRAERGRDGGRERCRERVRTIPSSPTTKAIFGSSAAHTHITAKQHNFISGSRLRLPRLLALLNTHVVVIYIV